MLSLVNELFRFHLRRYQQELQLHYEMPDLLQQNTLLTLLRTNADTVFGRQHRFADIKSLADFSAQVPVHLYDELLPYLERTLRGEEGILTDERIYWTAKTSGTTSGRSKYIPVTRRNMQDCHLKGSWMALAALYNHRDDLKVFARKNLLIGGGVYGNYPGSDVQVGDISAIMIQNLPLVMRPFYIPDVKTATLPDYESKIAQIAEIGAQEDSITMLGGVPTWNLTLYRRILEITGASNLLEVWPNLQAYIHGGVSFDPYRQHFREIIPSDDFLYLEVYNASEGFFSLQDQLDRSDMLLLLNNGIYYEFIPYAVYKAGGRDTVSLDQVSVGEQYALVITTNAGLYRYLIGDLVTFTSTNPYRIRISGRTQEYINAFGEDLLLNQAEKALLVACQQHGASVYDYTVAPYYVKLQERGRHQWFVEFTTSPSDLTAFAMDLDEAMQQENSNYRQKRSNNLAVDRLEVVPVPTGFFTHWLRSRGKVGGQSKVPKLVNDRRFADEILSMLANDIPST